MSGQDGDGQNGRAHQQAPESASPRTQVGTLTAEAGQLLDALAARLAAAQAARTIAGGPGSPGGPGGPGGSSGPGGVAPTDAAEMVPCPQCGRLPDDGATPMCTSCPLCRLLAVLRGQRPEVTAALVDAAALVVSTLRALIPDSPAATPAPAAPSARPEKSTETSGVQRIHIQ